MRQLILCIFIFVGATASLQAQNRIPAVDKSPMDASYYPVNYPILRIQGKATEPLAARLIYSRPQRNGRSVFGELVEYGQVWRLGANEASEIEFFRDVKVNGNRVKKGRYTIYCVPTTERWTIILNRDTDIWGAFKYDDKKDVLRTSIAVQRPPDPVEALSMYFEKNGSGFDLVMAWDNVQTKLPITF